MAARGERQDGKVTIKKYANRRLYNTATSSYVTLDHLCQMVKEDVEFIVYDAKTGEDITRSVLTQIIVEEEGKGQNLLPIGFLRQLIAFYGDSMQHMLVPRYLEYSLQSFARNQERLRSYMQDTFGTMFPFGPLEEMGKQNMAMLEQAVKMFNPFEHEHPPSGPTADTGETSQAAQIEKLQRKLDELQRQVDRMSLKSGE